MNTERIRIQPDAVTEAELKPAVEVMLSAGVVAFPTDTVYGLGADGTNASAVDKLYAVKGRARVKPVPLLVSSMEMAMGLVAELPETGRRLVDAFWPGALTLVLRSGPRVPPAVTAGTGTVGLRMPASRAALALVRALERPVAAPSANVSGAGDASSPEAVLASLAGRIDLIIDGGVIPGAIPSTVVDVTVQPPCIVREGVIKRREVEDVVGRVVGPQRMLFVCTGNSCRSVMAEVMFREMLEEKGIRSVAVASAGVAAPPDMPPTPEVIEVMGESEMDASGHRSRQVTRPMAEHADLIIAMSESHRERILVIMPHSRGKVFLLSEFFSRKNGSVTDVPDPIGRPVAFYRESAWMIRDGLEGLLKKLQAGRIGGLGPLLPSSGKCTAGGEGT